MPSSSPCPRSTKEKPAKRRSSCSRRCFESTRPTPGNERPAAELLARLFEREGIEHTVLESEPTRASVVARLRGTGERGPLLLNGHLDVVPADREHWSHDPFAAVEADGCVWGRGAIDMKNMVAMSAMTLIALKRSGAKLARDVIFAGVADEEAGSNKGALFLVNQHPDLVRAEYVLNEVGGTRCTWGRRASIRCRCPRRASVGSSW